MRWKKRRAIQRSACGRRRLRCSCVIALIGRTVRFDKVGANGLALRLSTNQRSVRAHLLAGGHQFVLNRVTQQIDYRLRAQTLLHGHLMGADRLNT